MRLEDVLQRLRKKVAERQGAITSKLVSGQCGDIAVYKLFVGEHKGLGQLDEMIVATLRELDAEEDD